MTAHTQQPTDDRPLNRHDIRMVLTAGLGFFTDAYDLFIIGIVTTLLIPLWGLSITQVAIMNGASLIAAAVGAISFGWLSDKFGRKRMYGLEVIILLVGALLCACALSYTWLLIARVFVGIGIGGDYPSSAVITSEYSNQRHRGLLVLLVFAMQALGLIVGPLLASLLLWAHLPEPMIWRTLLGMGAIPAAIVFYLRRQLKETKRFINHQSSIMEVSRAVSAFSGHQEPQQKKKHEPSRLTKHWKQLMACSLAWFLFDIVFYGNGISSTLILKHINPHATLLASTLIMASLFAVFALPGYLLAATTIDRIGRKRLQVMGFIAIALCYVLLAKGYQHQWPTAALIACFGLSFFFCNYGPNTTTFLIPSEIFPTAIRARCHGIAAATGKIGAFVGAVCMPVVLHHGSISVVMTLLAGVSITGMIVSQWVPDMTRQSLDVVELSLPLYNEQPQ